MGGFSSTLRGNDGEGRGGPSGGKAAVVAHASVGKRRWVPKMTTRPPGAFTVVSYNILADCYISEGQYPYCPPALKGINARHHQIMAELEALDGDVVCLQEVETEYFDVALAPAMEELGYAGRALRKTGDVAEGLAFFYKTSLFEVVEEREISLNELAAEACAAIDVDPAKARVLTDNVALAMFVKDKARGLPFCVTVVHGYWNWMQCDVQTFHMALLLQKLAVLTEERETPLILCGDFNLLPTSPGYVLLATGEIEDEVHGEALVSVNPVFVGSERGMGEDNPYQMLFRLARDYFTHPIADLQSAYATVVRGEPVTTNYTNTFSGTLDYLWYQSSRIRAERVRAVPLPDELGEGCPNAEYPSDHLAIQAMFTLLPPR